MTTDIPGVVVLQPRVFGDERGFFLESWNRRVFADLDINVDFVQDNHSRSARGILRGLHYQTQCVQGKLVRVASGRVFDVAVDMRADSPYCGRWVGLELSVEKNNMLWIPPGFAHGFYVLSEYADFIYKCTEYYAPDHEITLSWDDPDLAIEWPLLEGQPPLLSGKDSSGMSFREAPRL